MDGFKLSAKQLATNKVSMLLVLDTFKLIEEMMGKPKFPKSLNAHHTSWREKQKSFTTEKVEFIQDQRILDFFSKSPVLTIGDVEYFQDKLNISTKEQYNQCLAIINKKTSNFELVDLLQHLKNINRVCLSINKFLIYTRSNYNNVVEDYDQALLDFVKTIFKNRDIKHYFVKDLKGDHFNFASPTTQFFIT